MTVLSRLWRLAGLPLRVVRARTFGRVLFYGWNGLFLLFMLGGILPFVAAPLVEDTLLGRVPLGITLTCLAVMLLPVAALVTSREENLEQPTWLLRLFYGVELPLFFLLLGRLFLVREMTAGTWQLALVADVGMLSFFLELLRGLPRDRRGTLLVVAGHTCAALVALYVSALLSFWVVPLAGQVLSELLAFKWVGPFFRELTHVPFRLTFTFLVGSALFVTTGSLFLAFPVAVVGLFAAAFVRVLRAARSQGLFAPALAVVGGVVVVQAALFAGLNQQPQVAMWERLAEPPSTHEERTALIEDEDQLRKGLLNAQLASYRYLGERQGRVDFEHEWERAFGASFEAQLLLREAFFGLALPFLYDGSMGADRQDSTVRYEAFFDEPMQKRDREAILTAIRATYDRTSREAGLLDVGEQVVLLEEQIVNVTPEGDLASVEVRERYRNQTGQQQEIFYTFSLPESAVLTGVYIGPTDDKSRAFVYTVSARGAAQEVYRRIVQQRRDPALLEQVGPRQYRLRVFPIPPRTRVDVDPAPMYLWLDYKTPASGGVWPLPELGEARNVYWDGSTVRELDGSPVDPAEGRDGQAWMPAAPPASRAAPVGHEVVLGGVRVRAEPAERPQVQPSGRRLAVVVDRSRSMARHRDELERVLARLLGPVAADNDVDLYLTSATSRGEAPRRVDEPRWPLGEEDLLAFGGQSAAHLLRQLEQLRGEARYDGVLVVTDDGSYDLAWDGAAKVRFQEPAWMIHLGGRLPGAYDDATLEAIQERGGGVTTDVEEALAVLEESLRVRDQGGAAGRWVDGYRWTFEEVGPGRLPPSADDAFVLLAARQLVLHRLRGSSERSTAFYDELNALAGAHPMVTPYSSMLVLVEDWQRRLLEQVEKQDDRFDREVESGKEDPSRPRGGLTRSDGADPAARAPDIAAAESAADLASDDKGAAAVPSAAPSAKAAGAPAVKSPLVVGTPEPEEWALIFLAAGLLLWEARRRGLLTDLRRRIDSLSSGRLT